MRTSLPGAALIASLLLVGLVGCTKLPQSREPTAATPVQSVEAATGAATGASVRIFLDPVTGEAREPTTAEMAAAAASNPMSVAVGGKSLKASAPLEEIQLPNGVTMVRYDNQVEEKVCINAAGEVASKCAPAGTTAGAKVSTR
jgi:hypothetical protein